MTCVMGADVLGAKFESPLYEAVIVCLPTDKAEVPKVAIPVGLRDELPRLVAPSLKTTIPVGVFTPDIAWTVAVKVTEFPKPVAL